MGGEGGLGQSETDMLQPKAIVAVPVPLIAVLLEGKHCHIFGLSKEARKLVI
jgi:hypothetical protein